MHGETVTAAPQFNRLVGNLDAIHSLAALLPLRRITVDGLPYLDRYTLFGYSPNDRREFPANVYLHHFRAPDKAPHLHSHPWPWARSLILNGGYLERRMMATGMGSAWLAAGTEVDLTSDTYHSIDALAPDTETWSLFVTAGGPRTPWGFWVPEHGGYMHHKEYERRIMARE